MFVPDLVFNLNRRLDYLKAGWHVVNWDEVNKRIAQADSLFK